jgi:site-specific DNA-methyltransferase (adenine-specific)
MRLHNGDCLNILKMMIEDEVFVDSIVTDPPYHLTSIVERFGKDNSAPAQYGTDGAFKRASTGFMGKEWDGGDIAFRQETWELCLKVLKPGGHLLAFSASRNYHRMAVAIEDAGFEIRDQIMWLYGSGFPKSMNIGKALDKKLGNERIKTGEKKTHSNKGIKQSEQRTAIGAGAFGQEVEEDVTVGTSEWEGWGTALKPAHEPLVLARKPLSENSVVDNVLKHRTGGINIDECRVEGNDAKYPDTNPDFRDQGRKSKENIGIDKLSFGQTENVKRKVVVRKTRTDDSVFNNGNSSFRAEGTLYADADPRGRFPSNVMHDGSDSIKELFEDKSRYFYCAKTSKAERNQGLDHLPTKKTSSMSGRRDSHDMEGYSIDNDVTGRFVTERKNIHPTVKPIKLMKYLCRLITPKGGTILDPFMGSGSTGMAAKEENFDFIGIEKEEEYFNIASARIESVETKSTLEGFYD